jgi:apolipoprotein N-acyltransferase
MADEQAHERVRSWWWVLAGAVLLTFTQFQTIVPVAAWVAPALIMRFTRVQRPRVGLPTVAVVGYVTVLVALRGGVVPFGNPLLYALPGIAMVLTYGADRLFAPRLGRVTRTLVFPCAETALAFLAGLDLRSPLASWAAIGYTQVGHAELLQVTSLLGVWGLSFLVHWAAPVANDVWEHRGDRSQPALVLYGGVLLAMLAYGGLRVATVDVDRTVTVAGLAPDRALDTAREAGFRNASGVNGSALEPVVDDLFRRTGEAAEQGAELIVWSEAAAFVRDRDEPAFLRRAAAVAARERIHLAVGLVVILGDGTVENRLVLFGPDGGVRWDYDKSTTVPGDGNSPGPGILPVVDTPFGRLSGLICFDADFPALAGQAGRAGADILLVPSSDWQQIGALHAELARVRAVENGVSVVRPTRRGTSVVVDPYGATLVSSDFFTATDHTVYAQVPVDGVPTLYRTIGETVGYAAVAGVVVLGAAAWARGRPRRTHPVRGSPRGARIRSAWGRRALGPRPRPSP